MIFIDCLKKSLIILLCCCFINNVKSQKKIYAAGNAHSHNDYKQPHPFTTAYDAGFGSIEADIFLRNGRLLVAHDTSEILTGNTIQKLYLDPLLAKIKANNGQVYQDASRQLILLIDVKEEAGPTLKKLVEIFSDYTTLVDCPSLKLVITGNQPAEALLQSYPAWLYFDGNLKKTYSKKALKKIALFSDNFKNYSKWNGIGLLAKTDQLKLDTAIDKAHALNKPIRFWGAPDISQAWLRFMQMDVDYINTDSINSLALFIEKLLDAGSNGQAGIFEVPLH